MVAELQCSELTAGGSSSPGNTQSNDQLQHIKNLGTINQCDTVLDKDWAILPNNYSIFYMSTIFIKIYTVFENNVKRLMQTGARRRSQALVNIFSITIHFWRQDISVKSTILSWLTV